MRNVRFVAATCKGESGVARSLRPPVPANLLLLQPRHLLGDPGRGFPAPQIVVEPVENAALVVGLVLLQTRRASP